MAKRCYNCDHGNKGFTPDPEVCDECNGYSAWKPLRIQYFRESLTFTIAVVAKVNTLYMNWTAHAGLDDLPSSTISERGEKIPQKIAKRLFPKISKKYKWWA
jgi:hypothetical protein